MNERDILTEKKYAREEGREEGLVEGHANGLQEGLAKGREEVALNLKKSGVDFATISQATGLTIEQVQNL